MTKLKSRLLKEATARPAERVSRGWISEGYSQARGPYDQAYALHNCMPTMETVTSTVKRNGPCFFALHDHQQGIAHLIRNNLCPAGLHRISLSLQCIVLCTTVTSTQNFVSIFENKLISAVSRSLYSSTS